MYMLLDVIAVSLNLSVFIRQTQYIGIANITQPINIIFPVITTTDGLIKQTTIKYGSYFTSIFMPQYWAPMSEAESTTDQPTKH